MNKLKCFLAFNESGPVKKLIAMCVLLLLFTNSIHAQTNPKPKTAVVKTATQGSVVMCELMPGTDVASKAPYTIPFKSTEAWPVAGIKTGCRYIFKSQNDQAYISIALTDLGSSKNALSSYNNAWQASKDLWGEDPVPVVVLKDTGFFSGKDECGIKLQLGKYILDINFKGQFPDVSDEQKKQSGIKLAEMLLGRWKELGIGNKL